MLNSVENINKVGNSLSHYSNKEGYISFEKLFEAIRTILKTNEPDTQKFIYLLEENNMIEPVINDMVIGDINFKIKSIQEIRKLKIKEIFDDSE